MNNKTTSIILLVLIAAAIIVGVILYPFLPEQIASHWNASGQVDSYMNKFWGTLLIPVMMAFMFLIYLLIPKIDPLRKNIGIFRPQYNLFWIYLFTFFLYIFILMMLWNTGTHINIGLAVVPAVALLFYLLGGILEKIKRNWFFGIRTPWTLSSDIVWEKTHRLGGKLFKLLGLIILLGIFVKNTPSFVLIIVIPVVAVVLITLIYSYVEYRKIKS